GLLLMLRNLYFPDAEPVSAHEYRQESVLITVNVHRLDDLPPKQPHATRNVVQLDAHHSLQNGMKGARLQASAPTVLPRPPTYGNEVVAVQRVEQPWNRRWIDLIVRGKCQDYLPSGQIETRRQRRRIAIPLGKLDDGEVLLVFLESQELFEQCPVIPIYDEDELVAQPGRLHVLLVTIVQFAHGWNLSRIAQDDDYGELDILAHHGFPGRFGMDAAYGSAFVHLTGRRRRNFRVATAELALCRRKHVSTSPPSADSPHGLRPCRR